MILDDVPNGAGALVETSSPLNAEILRHRDLNTVDVVTIPERLHECIREPKHQHVVHGLFAEVVVDPKNRPLIKHLVQHLIEIARGCKIPSERFFNDHAGTL